MSRNAARALKPRSGACIARFSAVDLALFDNLLKLRAVLLLRTAPRGSKQAMARALAAELKVN
jgi:hypothetical protein